MVCSLQYNTHTRLQTDLELVHNIAIRPLTAQSNILHENLSIRNYSIRQYYDFMLTFFIINCSELDLCNENNWRWMGFFFTFN